uniref:Uncharacterized protein n=1 Tax=Wuchereria bancrofti TaxID=6293 RepID=A0AAF5PSG7_WUCBA
MSKRVETDTIESHLSDKGALTICATQNNDRLTCSTKHSYSSIPKGTGSIFKFFALRRHSLVIEKQFVYLCEIASYTANDIYDKSQLKVQKRGYTNI